MFLPAWRKPEELIAVLYLVLPFFDLKLHTIERLFMKGMGTPG
ncbi:hypothetical protein C942_00663 [Photobacterium marinum]|uniref:Uncharacterized protein n=1 Tax=Photobacterium marinum TaxID=1056511 RepID=L8J9M5_9GAMM|nr:hypothetical protein C942_00663 [Photobacterium marinum]